MGEELLPVISSALAESKPIVRPLVWRRCFHKHELPYAAMRLGAQFELTSHLVQAVVAGLGVGLVRLVEDELLDGSLKLAIASPLQTGLGYYLFVPPLKADLPLIFAFRSWLMEARTEVLA
jgi:DNA-binding transcriptional LysR family regulator